jgi:hypothetical protein
MMATSFGRNLIIGGHFVEKGRYPYFVSIDKNNGVVVAGALIAPDIVLSAGHVALDNMGNLTIKIGTYDVHNDPSTFSEEIPVERWVLPDEADFQWDEFAPGYFANDFMIFKLAHKAIHHKPIQLNRNDSIPAAGRAVRIMGLGWTNVSFPSPSSIVKEINMLIVSNEDCANTTDPLRGSYDGLIVPSMICTKSPLNTTRDAW